MESNNDHREGDYSDVPCWIRIEHNQWPYTPKSSPKKHALKKYPQELIDKVSDLRAKGKGFVSIGRILSVKTGVIRNICENRLGENE